MKSDQLLPIELERVSERMSIVKYLRLSDYQQKKVQKSCINKTRYENIKDIAKALVNKYDDTKIALSIYKCPFCKGYHLTSCGSKERKQVYEMITEWKRKNNMPIPEGDVSTFLSMKKRKT